MTNDSPSSKDAENYPAGVSAPAPKGDKDIESEDKASTVLNGYDAEVINQFREMQIDDKDILGVLALRAMSEGDKKEVDRLFDAGADGIKALPSNDFPIVEKQPDPP